MPSKKKAKNIDNIKDGPLNCCENYTKCPGHAQKLLQNRLFKSSEAFFIKDHMEDQLDQLKMVVKECIVSGESNSVLIIGPRGSGKTKLVNQVMLEMSDESTENYILVRLSGIVHTDDKLALKDMARQMELENVIGDRVFGSFADNLAFMLDSLKGDSVETKSIILIIDEFDGFTAHKNQSLLYNLFDIAQSRQSPLCVIGVTTRLDVVELLEKRVKSRYSHRHILTFPRYSFQEYLTLIKKLLSLPNSFSCKNYKKRWEQNLNILLEKKDIVDMLEWHFNIQKDIRNGIKLFTVPLFGLSVAHPFITQDDVKKSFSDLHKDTKVELLKGFSTLELCLVVAAQHVNERREGQPFNFEIVYNEYQTFAKRRLQGAQNYNKAVTIKAFEHLESLELFKQTERAGSSTLAKEYKPVFMLLNPTQIHTALQQYPGCPTELKNWAEYVYQS